MDRAVSRPPKGTEIELDAEPSPRGPRSKPSSPTLPGGRPAAAQSHQVRPPPRWFMRLFWTIHRRVYRWTWGRLGLWRPKPGAWGAMRLTTIGRRTGRDHAVIVAYIEDGQNLVTMAMNGWGNAEPAWWLNLQAHPDITVDLVDGPRRVTAHAARGAERERLWERWRELDKDLDAYAARRSMETVVVVLEPRL